jgi:hypothetical protein
MPSYHNKFFKYETYAKSSIEELFSKDLYDSAKKLKITELRSGIFFQNKNNSFTFNPFPAELQLAPINTIIETKKGQYYVAGNFNQSIYELGKITSLNPTFFSVKPNKEVNFISKVDYNSYFTNHSIVIDIDNCSYILNGNNNDKTTLFKAK